jgi:cytochrome P450
VNGWQFNPLRLAERRLLARPAAIDPAVPYEHFGLLTLLSKGPFGYQTFCFNRLESLAEANRKLALQTRAEGRSLPPDTPDGNTFCYFLPAAPLLQFPPECAVDTGWTSAAPRPLIAAHVIRGRAAMDHVLRLGDNTDRGPLPYYYLQQFFGRRDIKACPVQKPAGLFAGQIHDNATWSADRALGVEMFALPVINDFTPGMNMATGEVCASLDEFITRDPDAVIDLNVLMSKIAYTIIIRAAFGNVDMAELHAYGEELSQATHTLLDYVTEFFMGRRSIQPDYVKLTYRSREIVRSIIDLLRDLDRRGQLTEHQRASLTVRAVLETAAEPGGGYDRLFTMFIPIIIGGHETTGITMTWAIYEMARNPELKALVLAEIDRYRAAHGGRPITTEDYDERPVSFALLAETLRMHSPISSHVRTALSSGVVPPDPETGIGGFSYPAGAMFTCSVIGVHRDPRRWSDPHTFRIERFFDDVAQDLPLMEQGRQVRRNIRAREEALDLLAFSEGAGRCLGQNFNTHEFILVLDALLSRYEFELEHPEREVSHTETPITAPEKGMIGARIRRRQA